MMWWQTMLISIGSALACVILGGVIKMLLGKKGIVENASEERKSEKKKAEEVRENALVNKIDRMMDKKLDEKLGPLEKGVRDLEKHQELNTESLVVMTRSHLKDDRDTFIEKGFATDSEKASWKEMLSVYRKNGGNHFREYVDEWEKSVMALPNKPRKQSKKRR